MATPLTSYKLIILFMLDNSSKPVTYSRISEFVLEGEYTSYFHLQQALSELTEAQLISRKTVANTSFYNITEDGKNTLAFFEKDISPESREEINAYLEKNGYKSPDRILSPADYYPTPAGGYAVRCQLMENGATILDLNMSVPGQEAAKAVCLNWKDKCQDIYANIMEELL